MLRAVIYCVAILSSAAAFQYGLSVQLSGIGIVVLLALFVLMPLVCGVAGTVTAVLFLPIRISWTGMAGFAAFYAIGCMLLAIALMPIVPIELAKSILSKQSHMAAGAGLVLLSLATGMVFLTLAWLCLRGLSQTAPPNRQARTLLAPALALSFAIVAPLAPGLYEAFLESGRTHIVAHSRSLPRLAHILLSAAPAIALLLCHDALFRRALDRLIWGRDFAEKGWPAWGLVVAGLALGAIIVLTVDVMMFSM